MACLPCFESFLDLSGLTSVLNNAIDQLISTLTAPLGQFNDFLNGLSAQLLDIGNLIGDFNLDISFFGDILGQLNDAITDLGIDILTCPPIALTLGGLGSMLNLLTNFFKNPFDNLFNNLAGAISGINLQIGIMDGLLNLFPDLKC